MNKTNAIEPIALEQPSAIAIVTETHSGETLKLGDSQGRNISLRGYLSQVLWLEPGNQVLIAETPEGANGSLSQASFCPNDRH